MFADAFRLILDLVGKIETRVSRQFVEDPDLTFAGIERGARRIRAEISQFDPCLLERDLGQGMETPVRQFARIFAIQPDAFVKSKCAFLRWIFSSSNSLTTSSSAIFSRLSFGDQPRRQR